MGDFWETSLILLYYLSHSITFCSFCYNFKLIRYPLTHILTPSPNFFTPIFLYRNFHIQNSCGCALLKSFCLQILSVFQTVFVFLPIVLLLPSEHPQGHSTAHYLTSFLFPFLSSSDNKMSYVT